jgi:hypothetical protein
MHDEHWDKDDRIDRLLFQSQLAAADFFGRELNPEAADPQLYVNECSNSIFSLLQKDYAPTRTRACAAQARLEQIPALLVTARANLIQPVKLGRGARRRIRWRRMPRGRLHGNSASA